MYDVVIIGAGLGGLQCGRALAARGKSVCVVEKERQLAGCLQTFRRAGTLFDTGFHYVGGMGKDEPLGRLAGFFGLSELPWHRLDDGCFDEIIIDGHSYMLASGYDRFAEGLSMHFPAQSHNLDAYAGFLKEVQAGTLDVLSTDGSRRSTASSLFSKSAYGYLQDRFDDPLLVDVVSGAAMKTEPLPDTLPLYAFAQTNASYVGSSWRLRGGGSQIADKLAADIRESGGHIFTGKGIVSIEVSQGKAVAAVTSLGERIEGRVFISDIAPASTLSLLSDEKVLRPSYRKRIGALDNTYGIFTVNIKLKQGMLPYLNRNLHIHRQAGIWQRGRKGPGREFPDYVFVHYNVPEGGGEWAQSLDLLTPMPWEQVSRWADTTVGQRGDEYLEFKESRALQCLELAGQHIPGLRAAVDRYYTSTPLTWRDYTGTINGSAYGIRKDWQRVDHTVLPSRTPLPNLYMTGQNLSLHGILGVSLTSLMTCRQLPGCGDIAEELLEN